MRSGRRLSHFPQAIARPSRARSHRFEHHPGLIATQFHALDGGEDGGRRRLITTRDRTGRRR